MAFHHADFICKCADEDCEGKSVPVDSKVVLAANLLLAVLPNLVVRSGRRCPAHNRAVGGAPSSQHVHGLACDLGLAPPTVEEPSRTLLRAALRAVPGLSSMGLGLYSWGLHLDFRGRLSLWGPDGESLFPK